MTQPPPDHDHGDTWRDLALCVTTSEDPRPAQIARARSVAARCEAPYVPRGGASVTRLRRRARCDLVYVVGRTRELLRATDGALHAHPGLFYLRAEAGATHPLLRAVAPADAPPVQRVIDATLGLAGDALHVADALGARVDGCEASPILASLLEEGLARMAAEDAPWSAAAARVTVQHAAAVDHLAPRASGDCDVVYVDPMFARPGPAQPGFELLRRVARHATVSPGLIREGLRVARQRIVWKAPSGAPAPTLPPGARLAGRERGKACDYLVITRAGPDA